MASGSGGSGGMFCNSLLQTPTPTNSNTARIAASISGKEVLGEAWSHALHMGFTEMSRGSSSGKAGEGMVKTKSNKGPLQEQGANPRHRP